MGILDGILEKSSKSRKRIERVFSRKVLGSLIISTAIGRIFKNSIDIASGNKMNRLEMWIVVAIIGILLFMWWEKAADTVEEII